MKKSLVLLLFYALLSCPSVVWAAWSSIAFNYAPNPPLSSLSHVDVLVLDPQAAVNPASLRNQTVLAYVSVGETADSSPYRASLNASWVVGSNPVWHSVIMDETNPAWREFFIKKVLTPLYAKGYRGFFLDTLDAFNRVAKTPEAKKAQIQGLITLLQAIRTNFPDAILLMNRGFELLPTAAPFVNGVVIESLFSGWNQAKKRYEPVPATEFNALMLEIHRIQALHLPVVIIDYVPPNQPEKRKEISEKIRALGLIPFVTDGLLQGSSLPKAGALPRKIILLYTKNSTDTLFNPEAFTMLALPIEYLGYIPVFYNANQALPSALSKNDIAGIVVLTNALDPTHDEKLYQYLISVKQKGFNIAFVSNFGFIPNEQRLKAFDIHIQNNPVAGNPHLTITHQDRSLVGFEVQPHVSQFDYDLYQANHAKVALRLSNTHGLKQDAVAITSWGGYALDPYVAINTAQADSLWVINPMAFLKQSLRLADFPIPDVTTENGRRLAFIHIDGDGFATIASWPNGRIAAIELFERILKKFQLPTSFSVVTADINVNGLYPNEANAYAEVAKHIYALPWVEAASHTFSHPFDWVKMLTEKTNGHYNLPVKNYHYNENDEIAGSVNFINTHLLPANKKVNILLWSGYANADEPAFKIAHEHQLLNMNGGDTHITKKTPFLSLISPMGLARGPYYQVFSPIGNEEYYTNGWSKPLYGYERVTETFALTDAPRRFKPVDLYYHIYSASTTASLNALIKVYEWCLSKPLNWIYASEYINKVNDAISAEIIKTTTGWQVTTQGQVRELRLPLEAGLPDLAKSRNVIGYNKINDSYYLHLGTDKTSTIVLGTSENKIPYLQDGNGRVTDFKRTPHGLHFHMVANQPIEFVLNQATGCELIQAESWHSRTLSGKAMPGNLTTYHLDDKDSHELTLTCPS
ncbi:MAG TPA: endo alpha-1,4 polygalactosaminidase [Gammaproteobacteria bacterium]|nr:endo alpha-1,4 polygalactosaminidase [Gammaproteobacteria bacterium]